MGKPPCRREKWYDAHVQALRVHAKKIVPYKNSSEGSSAERTMLLGASPESTVSQTLDQIGGHFRL